MEEFLSGLHTIERVRHVVRDRFPLYPESIGLHEWVELYRISDWYTAGSIADLAVSKIYRWTKDL
jgi:hypothetical protein